MQIDLLPILSQSYDVGRVAILVAVAGSPGSEVSQYWDGASPIAFQHLGNTEGEIVPAANSEYQSLTLPESTGPATIKKYLSGHAPSFQFSAFADPRILRLLSPTGSASGGTERQRLVREQTWWLAPEQLFLKTNADGTQELVPVVFSGGAWTKDGGPLTDEDERLLGLSVFFWKVHSEQTMVPFRWENAGKSNMQGTVHVMQDFQKPDGHQLWTLGADLADSGIDLEGEASS